MVPLEPSALPSDAQPETLPHLVTAVETARRTILDRFIADAVVAARYEGRSQDWLFYIRKLTCVPTSDPADYITNLRKAVEAALGEVVAVRGMPTPKGEKGESPTARSLADHIKSNSTQLGDSPRYFPIHSRMNERGSLLNYGPHTREVSSRPTEAMAMLVLEDVCAILRWMHFELKFDVSVSRFVAESAALSSGAPASLEAKDPTPSAGQQGRAPGGSRAAVFGVTLAAFFVFGGFLIASLGASRPGRSEKAVDASDWCAKSGLNAVEVAVCGSDGTRRLDAELQKIYDGLSARLESEQQQELLREERSWMRARAKCLTREDASEATSAEVDACLGAAYRKRIQVLSSRYADLR